MDWLKELLEKATITDGKLDVVALMELVKVEFPKHAVPKKDYNDKVTELKTANDTIADLKKENGNNTDLQKKIEEYETEIGSLKTEAENTKKEYVLKEKLVAAGVMDTDYVIYKQGGLDKFTFDKDGAPVGVDDVLKPLKESSPHLFKEEQSPAQGKKGGYTPKAGQTDEGSLAKAVAESLNKTEAATDNPYAKAWG